MEIGEFLDKGSTLDTFSSKIDVLLLKVTKVLKVLQPFFPPFPEFFLWNVNK